MGTYPALLICFLICSSSSISAQRVLSGTVTDAATGEVLPYVTIGLRGNPTRGVLTNEVGKFQLAVTEAVADDTLVFSFLGYATVERPVAELPQGAVNVSLRSSAIALTEVVVLSDRGLRAIVLKCFDNIPQLYGSEKHLLEGYFRRYALTNDSLSVFKEGFFQLQDQDYLGRKTQLGEREMDDTKIWVQHYRQTNDERELKFLDGSLQINFLLLQYAFGNVLRKGSLTSFYSQEDYERLNAYAFIDRGTYLMNGDSIRRIGFSMREDFPYYDKVETHHNAGELLINLRDYAILRITAGQGQPDYNLDVIYQKAGDGRYYPQRLQHIFELNYDEGRSTHRINMLFSFYNVYTSSAAIRRARSGKRLPWRTNLDANFMKYEPAFWENNPVLLATPLPEALQRDLSRLGDINAQFRGNARRTVE